MKKSELKYQLAELNLIMGKLLHTVSKLSTENEELKVAIDRRRTLYASLEELVNRKQHKSIKEMTDTIISMSPEDDRMSEDDALDFLLKIIG